MAKLDELQHTYASQAVTWWLELSTHPNDARALPTTEQQQTLQSVIWAALEAMRKATEGKPPMRVDAFWFNYRSDLPEGQ